MSIRPLAATARMRTRAAALMTAGALLASALPAQAAWEHAHGDSANTGFARIDTVAAVVPVQYAQLGPIAPGANPVIAPDGTLYIGNLAGELRAFHPDGRPYWTRQLNSGHGGILAAPVVGADGSVYVVSGIHYTDHRGGVTNERTDSFLHKFAPGGGWVGATPFPEQFSASPTVVNRGATTAPPNIWRSNGTEAIIVPVVYRSPVAKDLRLIAFSTSGDVLADQLVTQGSSPTTTGGGSAGYNLCVSALGGTSNPFGLLFCAIGEAAGAGEFGFTGDPEPLPLAYAGFPLPGVAIRPDPQGGAPLVMVSDAKHDKIAYTFSPQTGFSEVSRRRHLKRTLTTPPVVRANGYTVVGTGEGVLTSTSPGFTEAVISSGLGILTAAPTRLDDGRLVVVSREGLLSVIGGTLWQVLLGGESIASAAASCTHLFVASTNEFVTYDVKNMTRVARVSWVGGGLAAPVISPSGHVYAIASDSLYVFPPPPFGGNVLGRTACDRSLPTSPGP